MRWARKSVQPVPRSRENHARHHCARWTDENFVVFAFFGGVVLSMMELAVMLLLSFAIRAMYPHFGPMGFPSAVNWSIIRDWLGTEYRKEVFAGGVKKTLRSSNKAGRKIGMEKE